MAGYPDIDASKRVIEALVGAGCSVIEIGIPYSDPLADGPTIQRASEAALATGVDTEDVFALIEEVRRDIDFSPVLMVYYNLVYRYGLDRFAERAAAVGVEGLIIPDLSVEEADDWRKAAKSRQLDTVFLAAPTSSPVRLKKVAAASTGFIYCVSLTGVTGARQALPADLVSFIDRVRAETVLPLAVGFGISSPEQAKEVAAMADGVIIGSAFIDIMERTGTEGAEAGADKFAREILTALKNR